MKHASIFALSIITLSINTPTYAQPMPDFNQGNMQAMMQQMQKMAACMEKVDQKRMKQLEKKATAFENNMKSLCSAGKRSEAQSQAMAFGKKMVDDPVVQQIQRCTKNMADSMKGMMPPNAIDEMVDDYNSKHVCDEINSQ